MHHIGISSIEFIPFFVLSYSVAIERKSTKWLGLAIAFYALSALSCWYYLFYIAYFIAFHALYTIIRDRALPRGWSLLVPIVCLGGGVVVVSPLLVPMARDALGSTSVYQSHLSFNDDYDAYAYNFGADVFGYVAFPPFHLLGDLTKAIYSRLAGNFWEATVYLGLVNLGVVAWWCLFAKQKDRRLLPYVLSGMAVFCILASGASLHILGKRTIPMPDALLSELPFFRDIHSPSRAIVFVYLFLAIGIGQAVSLMWRHRQRPSVRWGLVAVAALMVLDFYPSHLAITPVSCSPGLALIRDDPERGFGVLNLPTGYAESNAYMLQQMCHDRPIVQGQTSRKVVVTLRDRLETQNLQAQRRQLAAANVKYIVITPRSQELFSWPPWDGDQAEYFRTYPMVYHDSDLTILRVYPAPSTHETSPDG
jgi:hypothetical protein